jgi:predicted HicB family RNase H-like nuclease
MSGTSVDLVEERDGRTNRAVGTSAKRSASIGVRLSARDRARVRAAAAAAKVSVSDWIRTLINRALGNAVS